MIKGSKLNIELHPLRVELVHLGNLANLSRAFLAKTIVAFLNSTIETGGSIYFGVDTDLTVHGVKMTRKDCDYIRQTLDVVCRDNINPSITPRNVSIDFIKVFDPEVKETSMMDKNRVIKVEVTHNKYSKLIQYRLRGMGRFGFSDGVYVRDAFSYDHCILLAPGT